MCAGGHNTMHPFESTQFHSILFNVMQSALKELDQEQYLHNINIDWHVQLNLLVSVQLLPDPPYLAVWSHPTLSQLLGCADMTPLKL